MDLDRLLDAARQELDRVDHKAELLFTGSGVATGTVIAGTVAGRWSPPAPDHLGGLIWWTGAVAWGVALLWLAGAVYPRTGAPPRTPSRGRMLAYFLDVTELTTPDDLRAAIVHDLASQRDVAIDQVFRVSQIVRLKYVCLRLAFWFFGLAALCAWVTLMLRL